MLPTTADYIIITIVIRI